MDRIDEKKPDHLRDRDEDTRAPAREGDILGLGGDEVPKAPGDPTTEYDEESVSRRRERATGEDEGGPTRAARNMRRNKGSTGIDMGSGGEGTDVTGR